MRLKQATNKLIANKSPSELLTSRFEKIKNSGITKLYIMNFGFDLDRVFVDYPPLIPPTIIDWFYHGQTQNNLAYRYPKHDWEKSLRKLTHNHFFRPLIEKNFNFLKYFYESHPKDKFFLITGRYCFLEKHTHKILKKYHLDKFFHKIHINIEDDAPHVFKENIIKKYNIDTMVDDNLELLIYLKTNIPKLKCFWYGHQNNTLDTKGVIPITSLAEIKKYL